MDFRKWGRVLLWSTIVLGGSAAILRYTLFKVWVVPSDDPVMSASIAPTLAPGDVVLLLHAGGVGFGDLVRCTDPDEPRRWVIGRIAGEGNDRLQVDRHHLVVNGVNASVEHMCAKSTFKMKAPTTGSEVTMKCQHEALGSVEHKRGIKSISDPDELTEEPFKTTVQSGFFFLVSDDRYYPNDSRTYGAVPASTCDAKFVFRFWSAKGFFKDVENRFTWIH